MNEKFLKQVIAELQASHVQSIKILTAAIAQQLDANRLASDIKSQLENAKFFEQAGGLAEQTMNEAAKTAEQVAISMSFHKQRPGPKSPEPD